MQVSSVTAQQMKFSIKDFFSKCDQIRNFLRIWSNLLKKSLMKNFIFLCSFLRLHDRKKVSTQSTLNGEPGGNLMHFSTQKVGTIVSSSRPCNASTSAFYHVTSKVRHVTSEHITSCYVMVRHVMSKVQSGWCFTVLDRLLVFTDVSLQVY